MKKILEHLLTYGSLDRQMARSVLTEMAGGNYNQSEMAAFLAFYMTRNMTVEELAGFREAMLELCLAVDLSEYNGIDLCGTGGDEKDTFNISTLSAFIVAGAGQPVVKHGNNGVSSVCGSSNLLQSLGYTFPSREEDLKRDLEHAGICFLHAPLFHPAMKHVAPVRKELKMKTFFNMLGPLVNPSRPGKQLVGVFSLELARLYGYLLQGTGMDFAVVHSLDGYDEISLTGPFKMINNQGETILSPDEIGLNQVLAVDIKGGETIEDSRKIFLDVLEGQGTEAQNSVVLANAAMALSVANSQVSYEDCLSLARESLRSGRALRAMQNLVSERKINAN